MKHKYIPIKWLIFLVFLYLIIAINIYASDIVLKNNLGIKCVIKDLPEGYAFGSIYLNDRLMESPLLKGMIMFNDIDNKSEYWLYAAEGKKVSNEKATFEGKGDIGGAFINFNVSFEVPSDVKAIRIIYDFRVDRDIDNIQACLMYNTDFDYSWKCHLYPWVEDSKYIKRDPLTWVGIPSLFMYRDDRSMGVLWGIDPNSDYLNPTIWKKDFGIYFIDGVMPAQFRVGGKSLKKKIKYHCPMQIVLTDKSDPDFTIIDLMENWIKLNDYKVEPIYVRSNDKALGLFIQGRKKTDMWYPGMGYRLEMGDPSSAFIYIGEQGLSAYFDYLIYEFTGDPIWRERAFDQMDFILTGQNLDPEDPNYGVVHTAFSLVDYGPAGKGFNSVDRGTNPGWKPDLNAHLARYMLKLWKLVKEHEGIDRKDWYTSAVMSINWVLRQQNNDGGFPQKVEMAPYEVRMGEDWMGTNQEENVVLNIGERSMSSAPGRALVALHEIYNITNDLKYKKVMEDVEDYTLKNVQNQYYFTGFHPDLPPVDFEEAGIWGICEYWLNRYEATGDKEYLNHAKANAYLALIWWCPKQLSWVKNPTQCASVEQQHYLQYSVYCYQNRKVECLKRLFNHTKEKLFDELGERVLQNIYYTQITNGNLMGATHERICDPWLARPGEIEVGADFNSLGTSYMSEQSLDCFLQTLLMYRKGRNIYFGENLINKIYPDGTCYYSMDISNQKMINLSIIPSKGAINVTVNKWNDRNKEWIISDGTEVNITVTHTLSDLKPDKRYKVYVNNELYNSYQSDSNGTIVFNYTGNLSSPHIFSIK
jgi:hypothetical protein